MKILVVLALALACASAASIYDTSVLQRDLVVEGRITNGQVASVGQFPYQAGLSLSSSAGSFWCGGSLISNNWILTAAHCTDGVTTATVYLGSTKRLVAQVSHTVSSSDIHQHADYIAKTLTNDISLIKIPSVAYTAEIQAIKLPAIDASYSTYTGSYGIASGWGHTYDTSPVSPTLNYARLQVVDNSACSAIYGTSFVTDKTVCVATPGGISTCQGDSGGPLVSESSKTLIGITSFVSTTGCKSSTPVAFVRVASYLDWIKTKTGISYYTEESKSNSIAFFGIFFPVEMDIQNASTD